jgi:hypothetical protein
MSSRTAVALATIFLTITLVSLRANGQQIEYSIRSFRIAQQPFQNPNERAQEVIRRLNLPPNPAFKGKLDQAYEAEHSCLEGAMPTLIKKGLRNLALAEGACRVCDRQIIATATIWFEANKHRHIEPNLDADVKEHQQSCPTSAFTLALQAPDQIAERTNVATMGSWRIEGQLTYDGLLSYVLASKDAASGVAIELHCWPVDRNLVLYLRGPFTKTGTGQQQIYVTYSVDRDSPKQVEGHINKAGEIILARKRSHAAEALQAAIGKTKETLFVSASAISARFGADGFLEAEREWMRRCA